MNLSQYPARLATGAFILNSGLEKRDADEAAAQGMHGMAAGAYPFLADMDPKQFARTLSAAEIGIGAALISPFVPRRAAGLALTAFGGALVGMYLNTPGMRKEGSIAPTQDGIALAKDAWLVGTGLTLLLGSSRAEAGKARWKRKAKDARKEKRAAKREKVTAKLTD